MSKVPLTPAERSMRARLAAHAMHARHDSTATSAAARAAFEQRFVDEARQLASPDANDDEVLRRAEHLKKAYFTALAYRSARVRRKAS